MSSFDQKKLEELLDGYGVVYVLAEICRWADEFKDGNQEEYVETAKNIVEREGW